MESTLDVDITNNKKYTKYLTDSKHLKETIIKYGVAIIPGVINEKECESMISGTWDYVEHITQTWNSPVNRNDKSSWRELFQLVPMHGMLMQHYNVGHVQSSWDLRQNPKIVKIYSDIWEVKPEELLVSFDGMSFSTPPEVSHRGWHRGTWYHTDQSYTRKGLDSIQSWVTAFDVNEGDGTLAVLEKSNLYHEEFGKKFKITNKDDWYKLSEEELKFYENKGCKPLRIICKKGDMIFWDSRTIHCGSEPMKGRKTPNFRLVVYLCYTPRIRATKSELKKKQKAFDELRTTSHCPHIITKKLFAKTPRSYDGTQPDITIIQPPKLSKLGLILAGVNEPCTFRNDQEEMYDNVVVLVDGEYKTVKDYIASFKQPIKILK